MLEQKQSLYTTVVTCTSGTSASATQRLDVCSCGQRHVLDKNPQLDLHVTNKGLKPSTGTLSHTGITSAAQHDKTVSQAKTSGQLAVINHGQCSAGLECHFHRNMVQKRGWWAGMLTQNCALCTTVVTCTHNSLSLSTVGVGCMRL